MSRDEVEYFAIGEEDKEERSSYYGGASVPFIWESTPGTPKHNHFSDYSPPRPLTPPPSYFPSCGILSTPKRQNKVRSKLTRIMSMSLFHDLRKSSNSSKKTTNNIYGSSFSWSSTSSSSSFSSSPTHSLRKPKSRGKKPPVLDELSSPTSTLCCSNGRKKGFSSSMESMKRALFSGPRHGSTAKALITNNMNKA